MEAWPQDDVSARAALLAYLEGERELDDAVAAYVSCFPPAATMDAQHIKRTWSRWNASRKRDLAGQIRKAMASPPEEDEGDD